MKILSYILLCHTGWLSATLMIYHEASMKEFGSKITSNKTSFGYSVTYTQDNKRLIVSAPKATGRGALFSCDISRVYCSVIPIYDTEIQAPKGYHIWLGATVRAGSNFFMTCAPRYREIIGSKLTLSRCYKYSNSGPFNSRLMRLRSLPDSYFTSMKFEHKMLSFGWSMDIDEDNNAVIGGPAMFTGRAVKYDYSKSELTKAPIMITPGSAAHPYLTSNFGYSVSHRMYNSVKQIVISSTYGEHGYGMVVLFEDKGGKVINKIRGNQVGAMFGASLCAARVDSKGQALLLVGAPTYTSDDKYNTGAVFIYKDEDISIFNTIKGMGDGSQFGYALANLGDLNGDDKDDIAISAPYEDSGQGAVYIYSGAQLLDRDKEATWLQRIQRKEYRSFGLSLYAIPDYDRNGCKELAIGIPENSTAVVFSCFATITVTVRQLKAKGKLTDFDLRGRSTFTFEMCLHFKYPELPKNIIANFSVGLDVNVMHIPKVLISLQSGQLSYNSVSYNILVTSDKRQEYCQSVAISVPTDKTYDPTVHYQINTILLEDPTNMKTFNPSRVTVSDLSKLSISGTTWIGECVTRNKCVPKLEIDVILSITNSTYLVGSTDVETIKMSVKNSGDPAYEACIRVFIYGVNLLSWPPSCILPPEINPKETLICSPIKLLRNNTFWDIDEIKLDMKSFKSKAEGGDDHFAIHVHLYEECNTENTTKAVKILTPIRWDSEHVSALGLIKHGGVINITRNEIEFSSKQIQHEYEITNNGPTTWHNVIVNIYLHKEFYLEGISPTSGPFYECTPAEETHEAYINHCVIKTLKKNTKFEIVQPIDVMSNIFDMLKKRQMTVTSNLKMSLDGHDKSASVTTTLRFYEIEVATWIIIVAVLFGLLIIVIMIFILYECGFLRRKKKDDLTHLRRSVQRQSMRRSTMIQRNVDISDKEKLMDPADEAKSNNESASTSKVDINEKLDIHGEKEHKKEGTPKNDEKHNEIVKELQKSVCETKPKEIIAAENGIKTDETSKKDETDSKIDGKPSVKTKKSDSIAGIIIGGLQKNIRHRDVLTSSSTDDRLID